MKVLTEINEKEVLRYLGHKGSEVEDKYGELIKYNSQLILSKANPQYTYRVFEIEKTDNIKLKGTNVEFVGDDIKKHLENASRCILLVATLGLEVDRIIRIKSLKDMADAVIFDSCASEGIENVCNNLSLYLEQEYGKEGMYITGRYSPGYGDFPLEAQKDICALTESGKTAGVTYNDAFLLEPGKSVTAVIGICQKACEKTTKKCESCKLKDDCKYRKDGVFCSGE